MSNTPRTDALIAEYPLAGSTRGLNIRLGDLCRELERDAEELANALRDVLAGHPVRNADELIARYSPVPERHAEGTKP